MIIVLKKLLGIGMPCVFHTITGLYCPGCGGTRAVLAFLRGRWGLSFQYHPLVLYTAFVFAIELISWGGAKLLHKPALHIKRYHIFILLGAGLVVVNWFYKNYMLVFRGIDLLPLLR